MNVFLRDILVCPQCKSALAELFCKSCHKQYSCENQIPEFLEPDASHASFPFERMSHIRRMELSHFWFQGRRAVILKLLEKFTKRSTKILDVGCGTGFLCEILREKFDTVVGVDQYVEGFTKTPLIRGNATELPIRDSAFDLVLLLDVLEHVDDERVLSEVRRVLTPGGLCVISVPAHPFLWSERDVASGHLRRYQKKSLLKLIEKMQMEIVATRYYQSMLFPLFCASRLLSRIYPKLCQKEEKIHPFMNKLFTQITLVENHLRLPWGSSLIVVCRKMCHG